jgi:Ca2+-binding RTX toxin-like protein
VRQLGDPGWGAVPGGFSGGIAQARKLLITLGVMVFVMVAVPAGAGAVTAEVSDNTVTLTGGPEANGVAIEERSYFQTRPITVTDGAGVTAGAGCDQASATEADCGDENTSKLVANLGDGNDAFKKSSYYDLVYLKAVTVNGEGGNDDLSASIELTVGFTLNGGPGDDKLTGTGVGDILNGGDGNDEIGGGGGADAIEGGAGDDNLYGDTGDDVITGDAGDDMIDGADGSDTIQGGPGQDSILGDGDIRDTGNDKIDAVDGERDTVQCGSGADTVDADRIDTVEGGGECEQVNVAEGPSPSGGKFPPPKVSLASRQKALKQKGVVVKVSCPSACFLGAYMNVKVGGAKAFEIDGDLYRLKAAGSKRILLKLPARRRRAIKAGLKHHKKVVATVYGVRASDIADHDQVDSAGKKVTITG